MAVTAQAQLQAVGMNVDLEVLEWASMMSAWTKGDFQILSFAVGGRLDPDQIMLFFHSKTNSIGYANEEIDQLIEKGRETLDFHGRKKIYEEIHKLVIKDPPLVMIMDQLSENAWYKYVKGYKPWGHSARFWNVWLDK